jgi:hypothetical protein
MRPSRRSSHGPVRLAREREDERGPVGLRKGGVPGVQPTRHEFTRGEPSCGFRAGRRMTHPGCAPRCWWSRRRTRRRSPPRDRRELFRVLVPVGQSHARAGDALDRVVYRRGDAALRGVSPGVSTLTIARASRVPGKAAGPCRMSTSSPDATARALTRLSARRAANAASSTSTAHAREGSATRIPPARSAIRDRWP